MHPLSFSDIVLYRFESKPSLLQSLSISYPLTPTMATRHFSLTSKLARPIHPRGLGIYQISIYNVRSFHATSRCCFVEECLVQTHTLINGLHNLTGLPWAASIPLTALLTRALVILPIQRYSYTINMRQLRLQPSMEEAVSAAQATLSKTARDKEDITLATLARVVRQKFRKEHGIQRWKRHLSIIQFPIWFVVMETLGRMAGTEHGMLGLVWRSITGGRSPDLGTSDAAAIPIESSFVAEGMLWFPNLLLPDPSLLLPFMLSATLVTSANLFSQRVSSPASTRPREVVLSLPIRRKAYGLRLSRLRKLLALAAGPATLQFPSAMTLYWISSALCSIISLLISSFLKTFDSKYIYLSSMPSADPIARNRRTLPSAKQRFRGPTMQDLRNQNNKRTQKPKK